MTHFIFQHPIRREKQTWGQLPGCSLPLALSEFALQASGILLFVAPDNLKAAQLLSELRFFITEVAINTPHALPELLFFPDWETLPYDDFSPFQDIISERLSTLSQVQQARHAVVITSVTTLMHRLCPPSFLHRHVLMLEQGQTLPLDKFRQQLQSAGYRAVNQVMEHGEYAVRGSILDVYPMGSRTPFRIELWDESIESLREFDVETQRTLKKIEKITVLPAREIALDADSIRYFRQTFREAFPGNPSHSILYEAITDGRVPAGIEYYLPLFFEKTATLFDYLPPESRVFLVGEIQAKAEQFWQEIVERYEQRRHNISRPILKPETMFLSAIELLTEANRFHPIRCREESISKKGIVINYPVNKAPTLPIHRQASQPLAALASYLSEPYRRYVLVVESAGRREVLLDLLKRHSIFPVLKASWQDCVNSSDSISIIIGPLTEGAEFVEKNLVVVVESQMFGEPSTPQRRASQKVIDPDTVIRNLAELHLDAPVVHLQFGIGRYQGLETIETEGNTNEFLIIVYAGGDKIYVPVTSLHMVSRYQGTDADNVSLHQLGTDRWQKEKKKAAEKIHDVAIQLLEIYAKRQANPGYSYQITMDDYQRFASGFRFIETQDQLNAIDAIKTDMTSPRPMDRLICGDVGFGKTEVAMRAAFIAVNEGKQVCILAPTTLLAGQHFETFRDRFAEFPVNIELLSRFRSAKESSKVIDALKAGQVDLVIGTHKLLSKDIKFKNLGLLIIDEEHRFGVKQKEQLKSLRTSVDFLSMTATPIPRTLNMAMSGIRDISLIATPPAKRLAIKTFWMEKNDSVQKEAILREILRGGQVYFVHNKVQSIEETAQTLQKLVPEAKIRVAHGQMRERELERIMADFYHQRFNVLVCTTIIETGIDIPSANTIIIDRADHMGLAQLHQLRGRVGRSHHQAYAYVFTPNKKLLTSDAIKRLEALTSLEGLGAGFVLATHDLEIRGAGELLGEEQSGSMHAIGFSLFMEMLDQAVNDLKAGKTPELSAPISQGPDIDLRISARLPDAYIPDVHARLVMYKRISTAKDAEQLQSLEIEMIDRFGVLPPPAKHLIRVVSLKLMASGLGINKITANATQATIEFNDTPLINLEALIRLIQSDAKRYQMNGPTRLQLRFNVSEAEVRLEAIEQLLHQLTPKHLKDD